MTKIPSYNLRFLRVERDTEQNCTNKICCLMLPRECLNIYKFRVRPHRTDPDPDPDEALRLVLDNDRREGRQLVKVTSTTFSESGCRHSPPSKTS